jgi:cytochrome oxidase assembly protein ShyY1
MIAVFIPLGNWQLRRAEQRKSTMHAIEAGERSAPLSLAADVPAAALKDWRPATARGVWLDKFTVLLNRNSKGRPGYWAATPLLIDARTDTAVLVLRGWLPFVGAGKTPKVASPAPGPQDVAGTLVSRVPRLFELWTFSGASQDKLPARFPAPDGALPQVQNLDLGRYARATGLRFVPAVLEQTSPGRDGLVRDWPRPSIDYARNNGYALQWFSFAAIAAGAWLVVAWRALRRWRARRSSLPSSP